MKWKWNGDAFVVKLQCTGKGNGMELFLCM